MTHDDIRRQIEVELGAILDIDDLALDDGMRAADVAGWDSLAQLKLLVALEASLKIKFQLSEMNAPENVGQLVDLILAKTATR